MVILCRQNARALTFENVSHKWQESFEVFDLTLQLEALKSSTDTVLKVYVSTEREGEKTSNDS